MGGDCIAHIAWSILTPTNGPEFDLYMNWPPLSEYEPMAVVAVAVLEALIVFYAAESDGGGAASKVRVAAIICQVTPRKT